MIALQPTIGVDVGPVRLLGNLNVPERAVGLVVFAHGGGGGRLNPREQKMAAGLRDAGLATLLLDLLTPEEARIDDLTREYRFDIRLLADRLIGAIRFTRRLPKTAALEIGLLGASTGAAAALVAAAREPLVGTVVSRGGRPDLAGRWLSRVHAPSLFIVGGSDADQVLHWNRDALEQMRCPGKLVVVPAAGPLLEEPEALDRVIELSREWFVTSLV